MAITTDVFAFFHYTFGVEPEDQTLKNLPLDSTCGRDCWKVILAGYALVNVSDSAVRDEIMQTIESAIAVYWRG